MNSFTSFFLIIFTVRGSFDGEDISVDLLSIDTGKSTIYKPLLGEDCLRTVEIFKLLGADIKVSEERRSSMEKDRIELSNESFFEKVRAGYLCIANEEPNRIKIINANRDKQSIFEDIKKYILPLLQTSVK